MTDESTRSQTGSTTTTWLVVMSILFVAAVGLAYFTGSAKTQLEEEKAATAAELAETQARLDAQLQEFQALSDSVGFRDASPSSKADPVAITSLIDSIKADVGPAAGGADSTISLEAAVSALHTAYLAEKTAHAAAEDALASEQQLRAAAEAASNSFEETYQQQVADLTSQLQDEQQRADNQRQSDQERFDELLASEQAADAAAREARTALAEQEVMYKRQLAVAEASLKAVTAHRVPPAPELIDGSVLSVTHGGDLAFIDLGGLDGLQLGTRFEVLREGKGGDLSPLGTVEVREVHEDMALVGLIGEADPFDPILPGDLIRNPGFDKGQNLHVVLLGDFPLGLSREFVTQRLHAMGAKVDDKVTTSTDLLVLGEKSMADEEGVELTETDDYRFADKIGVRIMRLDDMAQFLRF